ncbi:hypothetical protein CHLNCDRAFT_138056 [Chlorella variabilis]|uniref:Suppressor of forked domain-containing protein n=1 Tax=Chlorella variabilis TaxID=554065 RepID=E1Z556_CHLVA|nr:hypothetical protein CHLNCDRAFT_138056 [Chlorella variabilis]EFN59172.1 hypothetical protein CHLNCDRAFT_138056 [Chlorella variabilis]|eukprot:XP_005851274.1 hypothetical protein CHLNCDRAFT_138056 [Chlorella variabilis]
MSSKDRIATLRKRVATDPYDAEAWEKLVSEADRARRGSERNAALTAVYEDLLNVFPTAAGYWREYADHQMSCSDESVVKGVFSRCLLTCLSVDLWRSYLNFIKRLNEPRGAEGLPEIRQAYEFTLDRLGQDSACGGIWIDYIAFLQARLGGGGCGAPKQGSPEYAAVYGQALEGQDESQKVAAVRRAYQRALLVPTSQLEGLWRGYEGFEVTGSNKQLARRLLDEWRPLYQAARGLLREREARLGAINLKALALPPGRGGATQQQQAALWREYLGWERGNPQRLDPATHAARVSLAFEQALMVLFHYPDIWLEFAGWHQQQGGGGGGAAAAAVLEKGRGALPTALALHFAAADLQESLGNAAGAKAIYEELVEGLRPAEEAAAGGAAPAAAAASPAAPASTAPAASPAAPPAALPAAPPAAAPPASPAAAAAGAGGEGAQQAGEPAATGAEQQQQQQQDGGGAGEAQLKAGPEEAAAADGAAQGGEAPPPPPPPAAPQQQAEVKAEPGTKAEVKAEPDQQAAEAAAAAPAPAPPGVQLAPEQGTLAWVQYMRFAKRTGGIMAARKVGWRWLGDIPNTRALFERALTAAAPQAAAQLWDAYVAFEYDVGSLAAAAAVEARRAAAAEAAREAAAAAAAGAALDGKAAAAAAQAAAQAQQAPQHEALHLALLKYRVQDLWPASEGQRAYMERLLGQAPAPESGEARAREPDSGSRRDRGERERGSERGEPRRGGDGERSRCRRGGERGGHAPRSPPRDAEPLRLSRELAQLMSQLPPPHALEGPIPDVERLVQVILGADLSPDGIIAHEVAAARERRRQRRLAEQGGGSPVGLGPAGGGYAGPPGASGVGQKRKALQEFDSGSESEEEERGHNGGGGGAAPGGATDGGAPAAGGLDVYRMRRKQQRGP